MNDIVCTQLKKRREGKGQSWAGWLVQLCLVFSVTTALFLSPGTTSPVFADGDITHVVQPGETLSAIAARYGVSVYTLTRYNGIANANLLSVGRVLKIPTTAVAPVRVPRVASPTPAPTRYISTSRLGDRATPTPVWLNAPTPTPTPIVATPLPRAPSVRVHVVGAFETLTSIAYIYGTTPSAIKARNGLISDRIYRGQRLMIP